MKMPRQADLPLHDVPAATHNPGGKVRIRLQENVYGTAFFHGPGDCYRTWLTRVWGRRKPAAGAPPDNYILWIGLNPSTADASFNDPTIEREIDFSMSWDADALVKVNICDYRATKPQMLLQEGVVPRSKTNLPMIRDFAKRADRIVCAWGAPHRNLQTFALDVEEALRADGHELWCLGLTKHGGPRHPLYVTGGTPLIRFKEIPL
ncbi:DUF1643 domain-containing protein [Rhodopseudomonas palustris]|uniref:DUF1643 domain-containing protein n=1 Tax=Rhodopseudomonas palustris TaxID=1076 RepID=UPI0022F0115E|nr:DUF1643 domain-containing protein [Rhodopseudomonas palustris]WBU27513.1 DUF1643 domain-containing protein [Rhodopseudomonas palustris]